MEVQKLSVADQGSGRYRRVPWGSDSVILFLFLYRGGGGGRSVYSRRAQPASIQLVLRYINVFLDGPGDMSHHASVQWERALRLKVESGFCVEDRGLRFCHGMNRTQPGTSAFRRSVGWLRTSRCVDPLRFAQRNFNVSALCLSGPSPHISIFIFGSFFSGT